MSKYDINSKENNEKRYLSCEYRSLPNCEFRLQECILSDRISRLEYEIQIKWNEDFKINSSIEEVFDKEKYRNLCPIESEKLKLEEYQQLIDRLQGYYLSEQERVLQKNKKLAIEVDKMPLDENGTVHDYKTSKEQKEEKKSKKSKSKIVNFFSKNDKKSKKERERNNRDRKGNRDNSKNKKKRKKKGRK